MRPRLEIRLSWNLLGLCLPDGTGIVASSLRRMSHFQWIICPCIMNYTLGQDEGGEYTMSMAVSSAGRDPCGNPRTLMETAFPPAA